MKYSFALFILTILYSINLEAQVVLNENFNSGIPTTWTITTPTCFNSTGDTTVWMGTTNGWRAQGLSGFSLDSTEFAVVDSDLPGTFCMCDEYLTTPAFDASNNSMLYLNYDQYFRYYQGGFADTGKVQVYDGLSWITVSTLTATSGAWMAPNQQSINLTSYMNANMQVRFHYKANWDWFWAIDNVVISDSIPTSQAESATKTNFEVFPSVTSGIVQINSPTESLNVVLSVTNVYGQVIMTKTQESLTSTTLDLSGLADGVYFVSISTSTATVSRKIVKQ